MEPRAAYPTEKTYPAFAHRELSVSWIVLAALLGGRHRIAPEFLSSGFHYLEFGCGPGLNLLFNAVAHPRASFHGVDLNPTHIAEATARARDLGVGNVTYALGDLSAFAAGLPGGGPTRGWPEAYDVVVAHGVASWVGAEVREALGAAAGSLLRPGGLFYCSYNTYPGWLPCTTLKMLSQEEALRAGGSTTPAIVRRSAELLLSLCGEAEEPFALGRSLPGLRPELERIPSFPASYLIGEYHAGHQPLYVGPMHRLCAAYGLSHVGSASLPEMFPEMLDPARRSVVLAAGDPALREVLLDLATVQTFRRDLFAKGPCTPPPPWRRAVLSGLSLHPCFPPGDPPTAFDTGLGRLALDPAFVSGLQDALAEGARSLGEVTDLMSIDLEELVRRLSVLLQGGVIGVSLPADPAVDGLESLIGAFNQRALAAITTGEEIGALLSPVLLQPIPLTLMEAFFLQTATTDLSTEEVVQLVWMGVSMAGGTIKDKDGQPIEDPRVALDTLRESWEAFSAERLPVLRSLGLAPSG
jgi:SAM-dependent methyltransferase